MLTTFAHSHFAPFVALLCTAAVMAAACAALEDDATLGWWYEQARATRRFFVIAGLLGVASLAQGVDESVAWLLAVGMAYSVDLAHELRQLTANR